MSQAMRTDSVIPLPSEAAFIASRTYRIAAEPDEISTHTHKILSEVFRIGLSMPETISQSEIALVEVLNNIVEHGYRDRSGFIDVTWHLTEKDIWFETRDAGVAMPGLSLPRTDCPPHDVELNDLPEGGFGWFLIRQLVRHLSYQRHGNENIVRFAIPRIA